MMQYQKVYMNQVHSSCLLEQLSQLWKNDILCDAVLSTGTRKTKAHRIVLVAACPMLQSRDAAGQGNQLEVKLSPEIDQKSVTTFLHYLYDGFMTLTQETVQDVERIARMLQVDCVLKCCQDFNKNLEREFGHVTHSNFTGECADFKHVKVSDLHMCVSVDKGGKKHVAMDNGELKFGKKASSHRYETCMSSKHSPIVNSLELVQSDSQGDNGVHSSQSLAVSVAAKSGAGNQSVQVVDMDETSAGSSSSLHSLTGNQSQLPCTIGSQDFRTDSSDASFSNTHRYKRKQSDQSHFAVSTHKKHQSSPRHPANDGPSPPPNSMSFAKQQASKLHTEHQNGEKDELTIPHPYQVAMSYSPKPLNISSNQGRPLTNGETDTVPSNLAKVKTERVDQAENVCEDMSTVDDFEEDGSDADIYYSNDTSYATYPETGQSMNWYTQTFKDRGKMDEIMQQYMNAQQKDKEEALKYRGSPSLSRRSRISAPYMSVKQKVARALSMLKSPIVFLRPLQRKLNSIKVDDLKAVCQTLAEEGFGQFVPKHHSNIMQRDAFFKASPNKILVDNPILRESQVSHNLYVHNYNDISELTDEEVKLLYAAHPEKGYVQRLCEGIINKDDKEVQSLEAAAVMPPFSSPFYGIINKDDKEGQSLEAATVMPPFPSPFYGISSQGVLSQKSVQPLSSTASMNGHFVETPSAPTAEEFRMMLTTPLAYEGHSDARKKTADQGHGSPRIDASVLKENLDVQNVKKEH